ncbi:MAG: arginase family protein [Bacillota bacterium]|nr:arginase family protein [Bacillota bacterium]MDI7249799.1 arginase family protein [Bacillota bacterium]
MPGPGPLPARGDGPRVLVQAGLGRALGREGLGVRGVATIAASSADPRLALPEVAGKVAAEVADALGRGDLPLVLGDCSSAVGAVAALAAALAGDVVLIWLDAHGDLNTPETSLSGYLGGMPLAVITGRGPEWWARGVEAGLPLPDRCVALVGTRDLDPAEVTAVATGGIRIFPASLLRDPAARAGALQEIRDRISQASGVFFHLDVDVFDPALVPAVAFPVARGLTFADVFDLACCCRGSSTTVLSVASFDPCAPGAAAPAERLVACVGGLARVLVCPPTASKE